MLGIFLGEQNSGKTLAMTYFGYKYYKNGYDIYSNYHLNFKHKKIKLDDILDYAKGKKQFNKAVFLIDEIYLIFDSRKFGKSKNQIFSYFILQTSKRNVHIFGTAQYLNTVEKRFRENLSFKTYCMRMQKLKDGSYKEYDTQLRYIDNVSDLYIKLNFITKRNYEGLFNNMSIKSFYLFAFPMFKLYDTTQLLDIE